MQVYLRLIFFVLLVIYSACCCCQTLNLDSCGLNSQPVLNRHEILFMDSILFRPFVTKKTGVIDPKKGFDFTAKKVAFYSCTRNANTGNGFMLKQEFFNMVKPDAGGHAGKGIITFNEAEKSESGGFGAVVIMDCPYNYPDTKKLVSKLVWFNERHF